MTSFILDVDETIDQTADSLEEGDLLWVDIVSRHIQADEGVIELRASLNLGLEDAQYLMSRSLSLAGKQRTVPVPSFPGDR